MKFVLIVFLNAATLNNNAALIMPGPSIAMAPFETEEACQNAVQTLYSMASQVGLANAPLRARCVPTGKSQ